MVQMNSDEKAINRYLGVKLLVSLFFSPYGTTLLLTVCKIVPRIKGIVCTVILFIASILFIIGMNILDKFNISRSLLVMFFCIFIFVVNWYQ